MVLGVPVRLKPPGSQRSSRSVVVSFTGPQIHAIVELAFFIDGTGREVHGPTISFVRWSDPSGTSITLRKTRGLSLLCLVIFRTAHGMREPSLGNDFSKADFATHGEIAMTCCFAKTWERWVSG